MWYEHLFNNAATAQLVMDPVNDKVISVNQEACRLFAMNLKSLEASTVSALFAPGFPAMVVFTDEVLEHGRAWSDHLVVATARGELRVEVSARCTEAGEYRHIYLSLQGADDMEQRRTQSDAQRHFLSGIGHWNRVSHVFREFERENQLILDAAGEGIYGVDANGLTNFVNPAAERMLGYSASELAGRNMHSAIHHSHADGSHFTARECPIFAAFRDGSVHTVEEDVFWTKSGKPIEVEYTSTPIRDNGFIVGAVVLFRDVTQKKADRKRLEAALAEVESLKNRLEMENAYLQEELSSGFNHHQIIGKSPAVRHIVQQIQLVGPTEATVLISGESGTGKELIARAIHDVSARSSRSLIRVNCAAIPAELFESEFFGHKRGAFTGATSDRPGRFELADGGTLFLDEVGEIPLALQGKLLRVLQEQQFERVGESHTRHTDVRIIAATNRNLRAEVEAGRFREDLYFRLNVFPLESVALRNRKEDIPLLTHYFLERAGQRAAKPGLKLPVSEIEYLRDYHWPGNIRELENVIERQVILARHQTVRIGPLSSGLAKTSNAVPEAGSPVMATGDLLTEPARREQERRILIAALERTSGKVSGQGGAADMLGIKPTTLASRLKKFGINTRQFKKVPA
ncbi:MAG: sigma 54-interacting transcriptional regulator [Gammaproteobacteria bacterium]|nr:sigma 54-interacting transcriptional regulator [Gammaproteobacteria bacterium]